MLRVHSLDMAGRLARGALGRENLRRVGRVVTDWGDLLGPNDLHRNGEQHIQAAYIRVLRLAGNHVWDIGANRGEWTAQLLDLLAANPRRGEPVHIHLFEPDSSAYEFVSSRPFSAADGATTDYHPIAVSSQAGTTRFNQIKPMLGINSLVRPFEYDDNALRSFDVPVTTIDAHARSTDVDRIGLIKSDTEGNDFEVLLGASATLAAGRAGIFQFEYNHRWIQARRFLADVYALIEGTPYTLARVTASGIDPKPRWRPELENFREANWVLVRHDLLPMFPFAPAER